MFGSTKPFLIRALRANYTWVTANSIDFASDGRSSEFDAKILLRSRALLCWYRPSCSGNNWYSFIIHPLSLSFDRASFVLMRSGPSQNWSLCPQFSQNIKCLQPCHLRFAFGTSSLFIKSYDYNLIVSEENKYECISNFSIIILWQKSCMLL